MNTTAHILRRLFFVVIIFVAHNSNAATLDDVVVARHIGFIIRNNARFISSSEGSWSNDTFATYNFQLSNGEQHTITLSFMQNFIFHEEYKKLGQLPYKKS